MIAISCSDNSVRWLHFLQLWHISIFIKGWQVIFDVLVGALLLFCRFILHVWNDMLADLDISPFHLERLCINLEVASWHAIRVLGRVEIALELFGSCIEIECVIDQHFLELCLDARCPLQAC